MVVVLTRHLLTRSENTFLRIHFCTQLHDDHTTLISSRVALYDTGDNLALLCSILAIGAIILRITEPL